VDVAVELSEEEVGALNADLNRMMGIIAARLVKEDAVEPVLANLNTFHFIMTHLFGVAAVRMAQDMGKDFAPSAGASLVNAMAVHMGDVLGHLPSSIRLEVMQAALDSLANQFGAVVNPHGLGEFGPRPERLN
jgi:hypothetical protein